VLRHNRKSPTRRNARWRGEAALFRHGSNDCGVGVARCKLASYCRSSRVVCRCHVASDHEASEYAKQLRDAFTEAGWNTGYAALQVGTPIYGLVVGMSPPFSSSPEPSEIERLRRVLATAGLTSTVTETFAPQSPALAGAHVPIRDRTQRFCWSPPSPLNLIRLGRSTRATKAASYCRQ
jgi:hypothetical protein